jgi:response regulator RpfG family c-di-GMP phosphodiesterase
MKPIILCIDDEKTILESLKKEVKEIVGDACTIQLAETSLEALDYCHELLGNGGEVPVVICDYIMPQMNGDELLAEIHRLSPMTKTILLTGQTASAGLTNALNSASLYRYIAKPWESEDLVLTVREALKSYQQEKDLREHIHELEDERVKVTRERKVIDTLSKILTDKIEELEKQKGELEEVSKELNITTVEKILIEREAEKMSRLLSSLQNNLKNNLFIRSILHSLVNMLQVQLSIDKRENGLIEEIKKGILTVTEDGKEKVRFIVDGLQHNLLPRLVSQRKKTEQNIHKAMTGYVKAVQRSLLGESVYFSAKPTNLLSIVNRVKQKYREILEDKKRERSIQFSVELSDPDVCLCVFDFALINIIENLLTNSIRKVLEAKNIPMWIRLVTYEEKIKNETYTILKWMDNGTGVTDTRKHSIFEGDSDKTDEGDHGVGLHDIKNTVESVGGFIREVGSYGDGAVFLLGFPKVEEVPEIDFDKDLDDDEVPVFSPKYRSKKIVIADDNAEIVKMVGDFLKKAGIDSVIAFSNGKEVLDYIAQAKEPPDVILSDLEMEPVNGNQLIEALRMQNQEIPVLVMSGVLLPDGPSGYSKLIELNNLGVHDIVTKPVDFRELFEKLKRIFKSSSRGGKND